VLLTDRHFGPRALLPFGQDIYTALWCGGAVRNLAIGEGWHLPRTSGANTRAKPATAIESIKIMDI